MIPRTALDLDPTLPRDHTGWTPRKDDLSEEGFAFFRDTWLIRGVGIRDAKEVMALESTLADIVGRLSANEDVFDGLASALENGDTEALPERLTEDAAFADLEPHLSDEPALEGLELGVSGLVHALSAVGAGPQRAAVAIRGSMPGLITPSSTWQQTASALRSCSQ